MAVDRTSGAKPARHHSRSRWLELLQGAGERAHPPARLALGEQDAQGVRRCPHGVVAQILVGQVGHRVRQDHERVVRDATELGHRLGA